MIRPLILFLVLLVSLGSKVICQPTKTVRKNSGSVVTIVSFTEIPVATEPCTPSECEWWQNMRSAGSDVQRKGDKKSIRKFVNLFIIGIEKSYRVPIKDRPSQGLTSSLQRPFGPGVVPVNGTVELSVERRSDGSTGDLKIIKSVRRDVDDLCARGYRSAIFLPAVKDNFFVSTWEKGECTYWSGRR